MAAATPEPVEPKSFLQQKLFPIFVFAELLTLLLSLLEDSEKLLNITRANIYLVLALLWLTATIFLYNSRFKRNNTKKILFIVLSIAFVIAVGYRYWETKIRVTGPATNPNLGVGMNIGEFFISGANAKDRIATPDFEISEFYLNDELCSFHEEMTYKFAIGPKTYKTFSFNQDVNIAFSKGDCEGLNGNKPIKKVLPLLLKRLDDIKRPDLKQYISTPEDLSRIIAKRGDIFNQVMFTEDDILTMKKQAPQDYEIVKDWLIHCIGIYNPILTFTINNKSGKEILINKIVYQVLEVGQVLGGESGPLYPVMTYDHVLYHVPGDQPHQLIPSLAVKSGDLISFNVRLSPNIKEPGLCYYLKIRVYDSDGQYQTTEPFQIIMSKK